MQMSGVFLCKLKIANCSDCHVPRGWTDKVIRNIKATKELYHIVVGTIDTREKFEAHRLEMAQRVWDDDDD